MSRVCELSGKSVMSGHNVSHSERKTNRKFLPNLHVVRLHSGVLNGNYRFRIAARTLGSIEIHGGLDDYLLKAKDCRLSLKALRIKKMIQKRLADSANN